MSSRSDMCVSCVLITLCVWCTSLFTFVALSLSVFLCVQQVFGNTNEFCVMLERTAAFKKKTDPTSRVQYTWDFSEVTGMRRQPIDGGRHEQVEITFLRAPRESQVVFAKKKVRLIALHVMHHDHTFTFTHTPHRGSDAHTRIYPPGLFSLCAPSPVRSATRRTHISGCR